MLVNYFVEADIMSIKSNVRLILQELESNLETLNENDLDAFSDSILEANKIFLAGAGRSGLAIRAFSNRLLHLGLKVFIVGDITTPKITKDDLLIIGSGSGETASLVTMTKKAKNIGASIALNTIADQSTISDLANVKIVLPGASQKVKDGSVSDSIQPMGSSFEQLSFLMYDAIIMTLMEKTNQDSDSMFERHANLE